MNNDIQNEAAYEANNKARHDSYQWFEAFETLATARNSIMRIYGDRSIMRWDDEPLAVLKDAANQLSKFVSIAKRKRDDANAEIERTKAILWPPARELSDDEFRKLGARMAADPSKITSNTEGAAYRAHVANEVEKRVNAEGCCGGKPWADGYCPDYSGMCPRIVESNQCTTFATELIKWLDDVHEQAGLSAIADRLSVSSPIVSEITNV